MARSRCRDRQSLSPRARSFRGAGVAGEIDHGLARGDHAGRPAHLAVEIDGALLRQRRDMALLVGHGMRSELGDDLTWTRRMNEPLRTLHDLVHRFRCGYAGEDEICLLADVRR